MADLPWKSPSQHPLGQYPPVISPPRERCVGSGLHLSSNSTTKFKSHAVIAPQPPSPWPYLPSQLPIPPSTSPQSSLNDARLPSSLVITLQLWLLADPWFHRVTAHGTSPSSGSCTVLPRALDAARATTRRERRAPVECSGRHASQFRALRSVSTRGVLTYHFYLLIRFTSKPTQFCGRVRPTSV